MAGIAEELRTSPYVYAPMNLNGFLKWAGTASEEELSEVMQVIYMVEHRMGDEDSSQPPVPQVSFYREDLRTQWFMRHMWCQEPNCLRCHSGRGGWQFRWVGPWTCPTIIGDQNTPAHEVIMRAMQCRCGRH